MIDDVLSIKRNVMVVASFGQFWHSIEKRNGLFPHILLTSHVTVLFGHKKLEFFLWLFNAFIIVKHLLDSAVPDIQFVAQTRYHPEIWSKQCGFWFIYRNTFKSFNCLFIQFFYHRTKIISRYIKSSTNSFHLAFLLMIDRQYLMMFITKNRQKTTLLSPNHEA